MREIRRQSRKESVDVKKILEEKSKSNGEVSENTIEKSLLETSVSPTQVDLQTIQFEYEKKIKALELQVQLAQSRDKTLTANEEKILNAIRSEKMIQEINEPIIGRARLMKEYKVNTRYLDDSISGLESKGIIERTPVKYSAKIMTNSWKIL